MEFFNQAIDILKILVMALGAGLAVWGVINLLEGYGSDNPAAKSQGIKQLMAGGGVVLFKAHFEQIFSHKRHKTAHGWRRCRSDRPSAYPSAVRAVQLNVTRCPFFQKRS